MSNFTSDIGLCDCSCHDESAHTHCAACYFCGRRIQLGFVDAHAKECQAIYAERNYRIPVEITALNTMSNPIPSFMDETERQFCPRCGNWFLLGHNMWSKEDPEASITDKHMELCQGDPVITLMKVEQWWKETHRENC